MIASYYYTTIEWHSHLHLSYSLFSFLSHHIRSALISYWIFSSFSNDEIFLFLSFNDESSSEGKSEGNWRQKSFFSSSSAAAWERISDLSMCENFSLILSLLVVVWMPKEKRHLSFGCRCEWLTFIYLSSEAQESYIHKKTKVDV